MQRIIEILIDDISGEELADGAGETIEFALDGTNYAIDLSNENAAEFREAFETYIEAGRKLGKAPRASKRTRAEASPRQLRDWARTNGIDVPSRGRVPDSIRRAFEASN